MRCWRGPHRPSSAVMPLTRYVHTSIVDTRSKDARVTSCLPNLRKTTTHNILSCLRVYCHVFALGLFPVLFLTLRMQRDLRKPETIVILVCPRVYCVIFAFISVLWLLSFPSVSHKTIGSPQLQSFLNIKALLAMYFPSSPRLGASPFPQATRLY